MKSFTYLLIVTCLLSLSSISLENSMDKSLLHQESGLSLEKTTRILKRRLLQKDKHLANSLARHIFFLSRDYKIKPSLIISFIFVESSFQSNAVSKAGAIGLMQLLPSTAKYIAKKSGLKTYKKRSDLFDPLLNVSLGVAYMSHLKSRFTNHRHYIAAYNLGPTRVFRRIKKKQKFTDIAFYVNRITKKQSQYLVASR